MILNDNTCMRLSVMNDQHINLGRGSRTRVYGTPDSGRRHDTTFNIQAGLGHQDLSAGLLTDSKKGMMHVWQARCSYTQVKEKAQILSNKAS
jgi:hypothetical protein